MRDGLDYVPTFTRKTHEFLTAMDRKYKKPIPRKALYLYLKAHLPQSLIEPMMEELVLGDHMSFVEEGTKIIPIPSVCRP
jgi:hypothetical protein